MNKIISKIALLTAYLLLAFSPFSKKKLNGDPLRYSASCNDPSVVQHFDDLYFSQAECSLNKYESTYFYNLNDNFGTNVKGSCAYVAIGMLLSFYDSFWNDSFVIEDFDVPTVVDRVYAESGYMPLTKDLKSPGVDSEPFGLVSSLSDEEYSLYVSGNASNFFQCYLMDLSVSLFGESESGDESPYALSFYQQVNLLYYYLVFRAGVTTNIFSFDALSINSYDESEIRDFAIDTICLGDPVLLNIESSIYGNHAVVAYDFDGSNIYVHTGWKDGSGRAITHASLADLGCTRIDSAISLGMVNSFDGPDNYRSTAGAPIDVRNYTYPSCFEVPYLTSSEECPSFGWDYVDEPRWFGASELSFALSFTSGESGNSCAFNVVGNRFTIDDSSWASLIGSDDSDTLYFGASVCVRDSFFSSPAHYEQFSKPYADDAIHFIEPGMFCSSADGSAAGDYVVDDLNNSTFGFRARWSGARLNGECCELDPSFSDSTDSYVDFQFFKGISRLEIELSFLGPDTDHAAFEIQELRGRKYRTLTILDSKFIRSHLGWQNRGTIRLLFDKPTFRIRIVSVSGGNTPNSGCGVLAMGSVTVFESSKYCLPLNGYELDYNPDLWNSADMVSWHNCYTYMLNFYPVVFDGTGNYLSYSNPGQYSSIYYDYLTTFIFVETDEPLYFTPQAIYDMVGYDSRAGIFNGSHFTFEPIDKDEVCDDGCYKVALVFDFNSPEADYHWYRQNSDGTWSHKLGPLPVINVDGSDEEIYDPEQCNHYYVRHNYNSEFGVLFFQVSPVWLPQEA